MIMRKADSHLMAVAFAATFMLLGAHALPGDATSTPAMSMQQKRSIHTAVLLQNGKVLVQGGASDLFFYLSSGELYDWSTNTWSPGPSLITARFLHATTTLNDGRVLVVGGRENTPRILASTEIYDPISNRTSSASSMAGPREGHTATRLPDGRVLVVAGNRFFSGDFTSDVELYDSVADTWRSAASLPAARTRHSATLLATGKVLVVGGTDGVRALGSGELYDPALDRWTRSADMAQVRQRHTATLLPDGKVVVIGGTDVANAMDVLGVRVLVSAEIYDPVTDTWTDAPTLAAARQFSTATLLPNGLILIAGGRIQEGDSVVATAELYAVSPPEIPVEVVEFFNAGLDHYFISWLPSEVAALDAGTSIRGWQRTGHRFKTHLASQALTSPVCRFYLPPQYGDSHFFGRGTAECDATGRDNPGFGLEAAAFMRMFLPVVGTCPVGTIAVYRVFSNRADANHRYMTDISVRDQMVATGWVAEGDGPDLVAMCAPG